MHLIIEKEILEIYFSKCNPGTKDENTRLIKNIFEDDGNTFLLTENMFEKMAFYFSSNHKLELYFQMFIQDISDNKRYMKCSSSIKKDEPEEILEIFENKQQDLDCLFILAVACNDSYKKLIDKYSCHLCFFNNIQKANKCWLIFQLLSNKTLSLRYSDFSSNKEIENVFNLFFRLPLISKDISILDSYCHPNIIFQSIKKNGYSITFYTSCYGKTPNELTFLRSSIKTSYGSSTKIKFSSDKKVLHERTIAMGDFILESNHDFSEIKRENENWKIDITYSSTIKKEIENKTLRYNVLN